ncbi:MAG: hypothetical protein V3V08_02995 [Nannocystaceae bacterium]
MTQQPRPRSCRWHAPILFIGLWAIACASAPYDRSNAPQAPDLLSLTKARFDAVQVNRAKLRHNFLPRVELMYVAQAPARFVATAQLAGNELFSVAVNEQGYTMRYLANRGPTPGFYSGPATSWSCALDRLLRFSMGSEDFVRLLLGGAPLIAAPFRVTSHRWERRRPGHEVIRIENETMRQEIRFRWIENQWWLATASTWMLPQHGQPQLRWTVEHVGLRRVGGAILPERTILSQPGSKSRIHIAYEEQTVDPDIRSVTDEISDDRWDEADGDDWEDGDPATTTTEGSPSHVVPSMENTFSAGSAAAGSTMSPAAATSAPHPAPRNDPPSQTPSPIPAIFKLLSDGLVPRGDLCEGR